MHTAILLEVMPAMETRPRTPPSSYAPNRRENIYALVAARTLA